MKFSIKDFFSKCDQICSFLRIWSHLLKKFLTESSIFCAVKWVNCLDNLFIMSCSTQGKLITILLIEYTAQFPTSWSLLLQEKKILRNESEKDYSVKSVRIQSYSGPHFPAFELNTRDTAYLSIFSPNAGKCGPE